MSLRLATPAALALLPSLPQFPLRSNIWHAGSRERWQGTVVVLAQCNYQGRSNYSFKGNADVSDFQTIIRRRVPLIQALGPLSRFGFLPSFASFNKHRNRQITFVAFGFDSLRR